ncbi:hypothetical protein [Halopiger goleimassiliensis]|uniref:hypothetical protein n=1 Tax=Halopiger goleimassiliensis TaxID=1293048 RepID=UPI000677FC7E|nr:hypothetical protein [Halopiger goleimassiliensis]
MSRRPRRPVGDSSPATTSERSRQLPRRSILTAASATLAATAGCTDLLEDGSSLAEPIVDAVPADATVLVRIDPDATDPDEFERLRGELAAVDSERLDVETGLARLEDRTGFTSLETDGLLLFDGPSVDDPDDGGPPVDAVFEGEWSDAEVVTGLEDGTDLAYEQRTYQDEPVLYEPVGDGTEQPPTLGVHGNGRYVLGSETGVRASLATRYDEADEPSGSIRDAYDDARDVPVTFAVEPIGSLVPEGYELLLPPGGTDALEGVSSVGVSVDGLESGVELLVGFRTTGDADELEEILRGTIALLAETDEEHGDQLQAATVERDGDVVELAYDGDPEPVLSLFDEV